MIQKSKGAITAPKGFLAGATYAGIKTQEEDKPDLGILYSEVPCIAAGVFTTNRIKAAPVILCQKHLINSRAQAIVVNSGCANACTGQQCLDDAVQMAALAARKLGVSNEDVLVASTGVIGVALPMERVRAGIEQVSLSRQEGHELARAIMTTDTLAKEVAVTLEQGQSKITIAGMAKGAGMIHPNLATLLGLLSTDAAVSADFLKEALRKAVDVSFNMISIDGDTSPNDTVLILANGLADNETLGTEAPQGGQLEKQFEKGLEEVCVYLARCVAGDGEGATRLIEVTVEGAQTLAEARVAARTVVGSPLVKTAVHGSDPNWGRIIAALGRSGAEVAESKIDLYLDRLCLMQEGCPRPFDREEAKAILSQAEVPIRLCLNLGRHVATAWGCDLTEEYVTINSAYTT